MPRLAPGCDPTALPLSPAQGYLLSRIDGRTPWSLLREIGGLPPREVDLCLERWIAEGIVLVGEERAGTNGRRAAAPRPREAAPRPESAAAQSASPASPKRAAVPPPKPTPAPAATGTIDESVIDPGLDLAVEVQRSILAFEARLARPYHEILGVPRAADARAVKRAYFELSKEYHPDRYFRREIGPFAVRIERIFKRIVEAYELLSDPMARAEIERSLEAEPAPEASVPSEAATATKPDTKRQARFLFTARVLAGRKKKAKGFFEAGMDAFQKGRWLQAASNVRLAIAFDPWNEAFKERFAEVQSKANEQRAAEFLKEAESCMDIRQHAEALRAYEEALHLRPHDPELNHKAARLAWILGEDLRRAKEYAVRACELQPDVALHRRTLGQIYAAAGLHANARRELDHALRLDPKDEEARRELRTLPHR